MEAHAAVRALLFPISTTLLDSRFCLPTHFCITSRIPCVHSRATLCRHYRSNVKYTHCNKVVTTRVPVLVSTLLVEVLTSPHLHPPVLLRICRANRRLFLRAHLLILLRHQRYYLLLLRLSCRRSDLAVCLLQALQPALLLLSPVFRLSNPV